MLYIYICDIYIYIHICYIFARKCICYPKRWQQDLARAHVPDFLHQIPTQRPTWIEFKPMYECWSLNMNHMRSAMGYHKKNHPDRRWRPGRPQAKDRSKSFRAQDLIARFKHAFLGGYRMVITWLWAMGKWLVNHGFLYRKTTESPTKKMGQLLSWDVWRSNLEIIAFDQSPR